MISVIPARRRQRYRKHLARLLPLLVGAALAAFHPQAALKAVAETLYWEAPVPLSGGDSRYPQVARNNAGLTAVVWQDVVSHGRRQGNVYLSLEVAGQSDAWKPVPHFAGPFPYTGEVPSLFSAAISERGTIAVAALKNASTISVYTSTDGGATFTEHPVSYGGGTLVAPRIFVRSDDTFLLFSTLARNESFVLYQSASADGTVWTAPEPFAPSGSLQNVFVPTLVKTSGHDVVVFQCSHAFNQRYSYQLYATSALRGSDEWSTPVIITDDEREGHPFTNYNNQGASLLYVPDPASAVPASKDASPADSASPQETSLSTGAAPEPAGTPGATKEFPVPAPDPSQTVALYYYLYSLGYYPQNRPRTDEAAGNAASQSANATQDGRQAQASASPEEDAPLPDTGTIYFAFERTYTSSENSRLYVGELNLDGTVLTAPKEISPAAGSQSQPQLFSRDGKVSVIWCDTRTGVSNVYLATFLGGSYWDETPLVQGRSSATFGGAAVLADGSLHVVWAEDSATGGVATGANSGGTAASRVRRLSPDKTVSPPTPRPVTFRENVATALSSVQVAVQLPEDSSGIAGYSYSWSQDSAVEPSGTLQKMYGETRLTLRADTDGPWYFKARAIDYAGNVSESKTAVFLRDTTPPDAPTIHPPAPLKDGFLSSNTFSVTWEAPPQSDVSGYTYALQYLAPASTRRAALPNPSAPPARILTKSTGAGWNNRENGVYALSVAAIDAAGNIGKPSVAYLYLNKFIPYTLVSAVSATPDEFGNIAITLIGRGFTDNGTIDAVYLVRETGDGAGTKAPPSLAALDTAIKLTKANNDYTLTSDRRIADLSVSNIDGGTYRVALHHTDRGLYWADQKITVKEYGTVKMGDYTHRYVPTVTKILSSARFTANINAVVFAVVFLFALLCFSASVSGITAAAKEATLVKREVTALIQGDVMPHIKKESSKTMLRKGRSLKWRIMFFTSVLVLGIVSIVSVTLGYLMLETQKQTMAQSLKERVELALESLASGAKAYMPSQNALELSFLPGQVSGGAGGEDIISATITGLPLDGSNTALHYVWATNDTAIHEKIDTETLSFGTSRLTPEVYQTIAERAAALNDTAAQAVSQMAEDISVLTAEGISLALKTDAQSRARLEEVQDITRQLSEKVTQELKAIAESGASSYPEYNGESITADQTSFLFYKPVLYRQGSEQTFVRGIIILEVTTEPLLRAVEQSRTNVIYAAVTIVALTMLFGIIGSLMVASYIIRPIKLLASHVAMIRDTEDKEELEGKDITLKSRDEIGILGETVNDMTHALVRAAAASKDLTLGKEIQKMFIPLETDAQGRKLTTGAIEDDATQVFGYYEGAKGVSGDYFDCLKLDSHHYALIKCDVSGKGVPAALIMVQVATLFLNYFKDWSYKKNGYNLSPVVAQINDLIEARGFKGRFAAFSLCIYNSETGDAYFCNAGDNLVHIYEERTGAEKTVTLPESAAAGVFPSDLIEMKGGFPVVKVHLEPGDVMFLYTDGIEEAKRFFRDEKYRPVVCAEKGLKEGDPHGTHTVGQDGEEMTPGRVKDIIEAVYHHGRYRLEKWHNPVKDELLEFDFSTCGETARDGVMALVSVEKVFRMYKPPKVGESDRVQVDVQIDKFLNEHFAQYNNYCAYRKEHPQFAEYKYYTHVAEDDQYDDLTLIALKRKRQPGRTG